MFNLNVGDKIKLGALSAEGEPLYEVRYIFGLRRCLIDFEGGILVLVDQRDDGVWEQSGLPASPGENEIIKNLMPARDTTETKEIPE